MIDEINAEWEKSHRLTVAKLNTVKQFNKQDHKSKLMTEKYSLLPLNHQQLTLPSLFTYISVTFTFPMEGQFKVYLQFVHSSVLRVYIFMYNVMSDFSGAR